MPFLLFMRFCDILNIWYRKPKNNLMKIKTNQYRNHISAKYLGNREV